MVAITDGYFSCSQTPVKMSTAQLEIIKTSYICTTCKVRITAPIGAPSTLLATSQGLVFDSPQASLEFNGMRHSIRSCLLTIPPMHSIGDISGIVAELHMIFAGETSDTRNSMYSLIFPIKSGDGTPSSAFFASLGNLQRTTSSIGGILSSDTPLLLFRGISVYEPRTAKNAMCDDSSTMKVNYLYALKQLTMSQKDFIRFKTALAVSAEYKTSGGPVVGTTMIPENKISLISYIPKLLVTTSVLKTKTVQNGYVETAQVKCRPLDQSRDIQGNKIYVGGPGEYRTLKDELENAANPIRGLEEPDASADVSKIESILAVGIGVVIGVAVLGVATWYWFKWSEMKYEKSSIQYATAKLKKAVESANANAETIKRVLTSSQLLVDASIKFQK